MRFHYVPSTYRGRKFGKGFCGGAYRGCARICGGSLDDNVGDTPGPLAVPVNIPVQPAQIQQNLLDFPNITPEMIERARNIIAIAEATGKAQPITKKEAGIWSGIKNIGSKIWSGAKAVASNPLVQTAAGIAAPYLVGAVAPALASYVPKALDNVGRYAYNKLDPIYHQEAIVNKSAGDNFQDIKDNLAELATKGVSNAVGAVAAVPGAILNAPAKALGWQANLLSKGANVVSGLLSKGWNRWRSGSGYRGGRRARLRKGSPEAKAYMARLRAMRGKKKKSGRGYGGMLPKRIVSLLNRGTLAWGGVPNFRGSGFRGGMFRGVSLKKIGQLYDDAIKNGRTYADVNWVDQKGKDRTTRVSTDSLQAMVDATTYLKLFYDDKDRKKYRKDHYGTKAWPYKKLTQKRYKKLLTSHRNMGVTWKKINDYWNKRTKNGTSDFFKRWMAYNYYYPEDPANVYSNKKVRGSANRYKRGNISQTRFIRLKKEGLLNGKYYENRVPNRFADIIPDSKKMDREVALKLLGKISKKNIINNNFKRIADIKGTMKMLKQIEPTGPNITGPVSKKALAAIQKLKNARKSKKAAPANDLSPILSSTAAESAIRDVSTGPPPTKIIPKSQKKKRIPPDLQIIIDGANAFLYDLRKEIKEPGFEAFAEDPGTQNRMGELKDNSNEIVEVYRNGGDISYLRQNIIELQGELELRLREYKRDILR